MHRQAILDNEQPSRSTLAAAEIWLGAFIFIVLLMHNLLEVFGVSYDLDGVFGLLTFLLMGSCSTLIMAGGAMRRYPQYLFLCHLPLTLWMAVFVLTFL